MQHMKQDKLQQQKVSKPFNKGITPAMFLSPFYVKKGQYSMEISYGNKQKTYKPMPQICVVDYDEYQNKNLDEAMMQSIRKTVADSQCKTPKNVTKQTFQNRQSIEKFLNDLNFQWFQNSAKNLYYAFSLNESNFKKSTLEQPKGIAFVLEVNQKSLKENFDQIKKQCDNLLKRLYFLNSNQIKQLPILAVIFFDPNKGHQFRHAKTYCEALKNDYGIQSILHSKMQINGNLSIDLQIWSNCFRPIFYFNQSINSASLRFINQEGFKSLTDSVNIHKERIKKMIENRLDGLLKKYDQNYSVSNKVIGFFKGNSTPKQKYLIKEQAQARQIADYMFILQDYKKAYEIYKNILKDFQKRQHAIQMDLRYMLALCYEMSKFLGVKINSTPPKSFIEKEFEYLQQYEKLGKQQLTKFLILMLYVIHTFKIYDPTLLKQRFLVFIKIAMNMPNDSRKQEHKNHQKLCFIMPLLVYEQYSNLNLLFPHIDYRRYCYDTVRVAMRFSEYKLSGHSLRCLTIVEKIYSNTLNSIDKYICVFLSSYNLESKMFNESLNKLKKAWQILIQMNKSLENNNTVEIQQFKKLMKNHQKIIAEIEKFNPAILSLSEQKKMIIPEIISSDILLFGEQQTQQIDRRGINWRQIAQNFNENTQLYKQGYNKTGMQKIYKLYDCINSQEKELLYRASCPNLSNAVIMKNARVGYLKQSIIVNFTLFNPFIQEIQISDLKIVVKNTYNDYIIKNNIEHNKVLIKAHKKCNIEFELIPNQLGLLQIQGVEWTFEKMRIKYQFSSVASRKSELKPFFNIIKILEAKGQLKVTYEKTEQQFIEGQIHETKIFFQNLGNKSIQSIYVAYGNNQFYNKKYEKIPIQLQPGEKKQFKITLNMPIVPESIEKDWKIMDKKIFLYQTEGEFRVHRSSILTLIHKILYHKIICEKLSTHLHLLTFAYNKNSKINEHIKTLILNSNFEIMKTDQSQFQNKSIYYFFLLKKPYVQMQTYNFQSQKINQNVQQLCKAYLNLYELTLQKNKINQQISLVFEWKMPPKRKGLIFTPNNIIVTHKQQILPFSFSSTMPNFMKTNFQQMPVVQINFKIKIKNIYMNKQVKFEVKLCEDNVNGIFWEGITWRKFKLRENQQIQFEVEMLISNQGLYDISNCIDYTFESDKQTKIISHSQHEKLIIHIEDQSESTNKLSTSNLMKSGMKFRDVDLFKSQEKNFEHFFSQGLASFQKHDNSENITSEIKELSLSSKDSNNLIDL